MIANGVLSNLCDCAIHSGIGLPLAKTLKSQFSRVNWGQYCVILSLASHEAFTIFHKLTFQKGCHLPLLKIEKNMKQTISHDLRNAFDKICAKLMLSLVLNVTAQNRCDIAFR